MNISKDIMCIFRVLQSSISKCSTEFISHIFHKLIHCKSMNFRQRNLISFIIFCLWLDDHCFGRLFESIKILLNLWSKWKSFNSLFNSFLIHFFHFNIKFSLFLAFFSTFFIFSLPLIDFPFRLNYLLLQFSFKSFLELFFFFNNSSSFLFPLFFKFSRFKSHFLSMLFINLSFLLLRLFSFSFFFLFLLLFNSFFSTVFLSLFIQFFFNSELFFPQS